MHFLSLSLSLEDLELVEEERVGFVWISRERMAESRSSRVVEAPWPAVPPGIETVVFEGAGEEVREDGWEEWEVLVRTLGR